MKKIVVLLALVFALSLGACAKVCKPGTMRCKDDKVQLCDKKGRWKLVMDCTKVKPKDRLWCCKCTPDKKKCYCSTKCICEVPK